MEVILADEGRTGRLRSYWETETEVILGNGVHTGRLRSYWETEVIFFREYFVFNGCTL